MADRREVDEECDPIARLDFRGIRFPSDRISIRTLRQLFPTSFDHGFGVGEDAQPSYFLNGTAPDHCVSGIGDLLYFERLLATLVYATAKDLPPPPAESIDEVRDELTAFYRRFNIACGEHHAAQLIRDIERQARNLAQQSSVQP